MSDFHRAELLHKSFGDLVERCLVYESLNAEKIDKVNALTAENERLKNTLNIITKTMREIAHESLSEIDRSEK